MPTTPNGTAGGSAGTPLSAGTAYTYTTGGPKSSVGNPVQYQFTWAIGRSLRGRVLAEPRTPGGLWLVRRVRASEVSAESLARLADV
jgi:hypothetical protein